MREHYLFIYKWLSIKIITIILYIYIKVLLIYSNKTLFVYYYDQNNICLYSLYIFLY